LLPLRVGDGVQPLERRLHGAEAHRDLLAEPVDLLVQEVDVLQVQGQQQPMVRGHPADEGLLQLRPLAPQLALGQLRQGGRIGRPRQERRQDGSPGDAHHVRGHPGHLEVGVLQHRLQAPDGRRARVDELGPGAGQVAQLLLGARWHEAGPQQPVLEQVGQPLAVSDVRLAPRHGLHVPGVHQQQLAGALEDVPHGAPVDPKRLPCWRRGFTPSARWR
jgi:hypothetical protein